MPTEAGRGQALPASLLGLAASCTVGDVPSAAEAVVARAASREGGFVCLCNVHLLTLALHDDQLHRALGAAWSRLPDGAPVAWLQRRLGRREAARIGGPDLMPAVFDLGRERDLGHFLLGSTPDVLASVAAGLTERFPGARVVGTHSPPFGTNSGQDAEALDAIAAAEPDLVWCALGAPKQELWMHSHAPHAPGAVFLGVGAAFDFLAETKSRAPEWMRDSGLEWLHRLATEPARLGGRYVRTNTEFILRSGVELTRRRFAT
jgi:N-acetylglucosaminyldiphosphoundecaprenol N-acetyl-beta-D-mannosaminyltransferase